MVDEFSSFARMPRPELKLENLNELVQQAVFLERNRFPNIHIELDAPAQPMELLCDSSQVSQALINVMKNAAEAVEGRNGVDAVLPPGWIGVTVREEIINDVQRLVYVDVEDNGRGLPEENRDRLTEPYVTTRTKGTGLGLAIVKKIMEDHNGDLSIEDRDCGGARVSLVFKEARARPEPRNGPGIVEVEPQPSYAELHANG
jgi:two-component system nitrogen regulation sensor histidine kinase NtrY